MRRTWRVHRWFSPSRESEPRFTKSFRSAFLVPMAALALAVAVDLERVLAAWVCCASTCRSEASRQPPYCSSLTCSIQSTTFPIRAP